ncbi:MAG TPA: DUF2306 domain-containing protein [Rhizomicrobium sp.]|jgi:uncharacterized membrane protein|nr:DUF2306 domain-containing protein [Rhizomicrobium sp.]
MTLPSALTTLAYALHIGGGTVGFVSGIVAISVRKGARLHRIAGTIFFAAMLVMASAALYLAVVIPGQIVNVFIGTFALYLILTSWLTVRRREGSIGLAEKVAMVVAFCLWAPFALLSFQLATGMAPFFHSAVPLKGPVLIAIFVFTALLTVAAVSDAKVVWSGGIAGAPRIARHLWRMCLAFTMAAGSFFTNALPKVFPGIYHLPLLVLFAPQFLLLGVLAFWIIRVRLTSWYARGAAEA